VFKRCGLSYACLFFFVVAVLPGRAQVQNEASGLASNRDQFQIEMIPRDGFNLYYRSPGSGEVVLIVSVGPGTIAIICSRWRRKLQSMLM
jgi:hypothetical protein